MFHAIQQHKDEMIKKKLLTRKPFLLFIFFLLMFFLIHKDELFTNLFVEKIKSGGKIYPFLYIITYLGLVFSLCIFILSKIKWVRFFFLTLLFLELSVVLGSLIAHSEIFGVPQANTALVEFQWAGDALKVFYAKYIEAIIISATIVILISYAIRKWIRFRTAKKYLLIGFFFIFCEAFLIFRTKAHFATFPTVFYVPTITLYSYCTIPYFGARNDVKIKPVATGSCKKIIFIVDETIRGDALSINNKQPSNKGGSASGKKSTPYLESRADAYYNFGIASSVANTSRAVNMILQSGMRVDQFPDKKFLYASNPSIFQYAKRAGYKTFFIDGQNKTIHPQNNMTPNDFIPIDKYIQILKLFPQIESYNIDYKIIDELADIISSDTSFFVYVNKMGCHFPYPLRYPPQREIFKPAYRGNEIFSVREIAMNTYYNAVNWSVDGFFEKFLPMIENKDVLIIYCSDHGESILEDGKFIGHIQLNHAASEQANIPILIFPFGKSKDNISKLAETNFKKNINHCSQFQVFPTLLQMMGYEHDEVIKNYGITLFDRVGNRERKFLTGLIYYPEYQIMTNFIYKDSL